MPEPASALEHAKMVAPDVVVVDHAPGSPWERLAAEDRGVEAAWKAVDKWPARRRMDLMAFQRFDDYAALAARFAAQPPASRKRIAPYRKRKPITIEMPYRLALL